MNDKIKKVLLCSVFGPYGQDNEYGKLNPMELYQNQVTRTQGPFSLRMFHRSWGLMMIQANINSPCILLDFPTLERFIEEIRTQHYDIIGISSIISNVFKVQKMCELIKQYQPNTGIVVGGHIANVAGLKEQIGADYVVKGDGIRWFRHYLGEDVNRPINHPITISGLNPRSAGVPVSGDVAAVIIPSVGCPLGCNFCSTSAMFGGKGKWIDFYQTGDELFSVMEQVAKSLKVRSFFMMDENFLFHRARALRLLELMEKNNKAWSIYVFTSAKVLQSYTMDQIVRLGISWVWMGLEGKDSRYDKLKGVDTFELVQKLQSNGIRVLGSTIMALEDHSPENIDRVIEYAVKHDSDFHQFMLYTPNPGTQLYEEMSKAGVMKGRSECSPDKITGQTILPYKHPNFSDEQTAEIMIRAFNRDFEVNGPSIVRIAETTLKGWLKYKNHLDSCVRNRFTWEARDLATGYSALVGATKLYYKDNKVMHAKMEDLLQRLHAEFGWKSRLFSFVGGYWLLRKIRKEEKRLAEGFTYEPPTFYERNKAVIDRPDIPICPHAVP